MILIPFFGDQHANSRKLEKYRAGIKLNIDNISDNILRNAINEIIFNPV